MVLAPLLLAAFTAAPPKTTIPQPVLHDAIIAAAHQSAGLLQRTSPRRDQAYRVSPKTGRRIAYAIIGAVAGWYSAVFFIVQTGVFATSATGEATLTIGAAVGGGTIGWLAGG